MKLLAVFTLLASLGVSAPTWLCVHALHRNASSAMRVSDPLPLDYFLENKSFSEIENTKALLEALAAQSISAMRSRSAVEIQTNSRAARLMVALQDAEKRIEEFKGTEQELMLVKEQLIMLNQAGFHDRWLDVYLAALYEHPTHDLVGQFAQRALTLAQETGRGDAVMAGFWHLTGIPLEFNSKSIIQAALLQTAVASHRSLADEDKLL